MQQLSVMSTWKELGINISANNTTHSSIKVQPHTIKDVWYAMVLFFFYIISKASKGLYALITPTWADNQIPISKYTFWSLGRLCIVPFPCNIPSNNLYWCCMLF